MRSDDRRSQCGFRRTGNTGFGGRPSDRDADDYWLLYFGDQIDARIALDLGMIPPRCQAPICPLQRRREKVRDGEGVKKNKLVRDPQVPASEHQRVPVEASREQSTLALDIGLEYDK